MVIHEWRIKSIIKEMLPLLTTLTFVGIFSGLLLEIFKKTLLHYPQLLILIPVMIGLGGNLGAIFGARISTGLHLGIIQLNPKNRALRQNIYAILVLALILFSILGIITNPLSHFLGIGNELTIKTFFLISFFSGIAISLIIIVITLITSLLTYKFGMDPDNTILPTITSLCDMSGIFVFYLFVKLLI